MILFIRTAFQFCYFSAAKDSRIKEAATPSGQVATFQAAITPPENEVAEKELQRNIKRTDFLAMKIIGQARIVGTFCSFTVNFPQEEKSPTKRRMLWWHSDVWTKAEWKHFSCLSWSTFFETWKTDDFFFRFSKTIFLLWKKVWIKIFFDANLFLLSNFEDKKIKIQSSFSDFNVELFSTMKRMQSKSFMWIY